MSKDPIQEYFINAVRLQALVHTGEDIGDPRRDLAQQIEDTLSDIVRNIPAKDRGDLAGAIIRKLGQSDQTGGFSLDLYASQWAKYTPQAKAEPGIYEIRIAREFDHYAEFARQSMD